MIFRTDTGTTGGRISRYLPWFGIVLAAALNWSPAIAEKVPYSTLVLEYESCLQSYNGAASTRKSYCLCATIEMHTRLDVQSHMALTAKALEAYDDEGELDRKRALAIRDIRQIASHCLIAVSKE